MTLIVWVGNKDALAFAADSVGSVGHKTFIVNKLFEISDNDPVWVAIAGSADFMGISLETIIKEFRKSILNRREGSLFDYVKLFLEYVKNADYLKKTTNEELIEILISSLFQTLQKRIDSVVSNAWDDPKFVDKELGEQNRILTERSEAAVTDFLKDFLAKLRQEARNLCWVENVSENIDTILPIVNQKDFASVFCPGGSENFKMFMQIILLSLQTDSTLIMCIDYSKLIFFGFWEKDYFPKVCTINLFQKLEKTILYSKEEEVEIKKSFIEPYAQSDDVWTSILGIWDNTVIRLEQILNEKLQNLEKNNIIKQGGRQEILQAIGESLRFIRQETGEPLHQAVSLLSKAELWKIAENFVGIGSMKKRINMGYETIWGPIDVAVVTKADGFVWIKRKFYFDPDINYNYFNRLSKKHDEKTWENHRQSNEQKHQDSSSSKVSK